MWSGLRRLESGNLIENTQCWEKSSCLRSRRSRGWSELEKSYCFYHCCCFMDIRNICSFHEPGTPHLLFPRKNNRERATQLTIFLVKIKCKFESR